MSKAAAKRAAVGWARDSRDLSRALLAIADTEEQARILGEATEAACKPILEAARMYAERSVETGALRDSLTIKTKTYTSNGKAYAVGLVGPDRKYRVGGNVVGALGALFGAARGDLRRPANYAHLVEYGHRIAKGGTLRVKYSLSLRGTGRFTKKGREIKRWQRGAVIAPPTGSVGGVVPPKPFLRPAAITTRSEQSSAFADAVERGLTRLLNRNLKRAA